MISVIQDFLYTRKLVALIIFILAFVLFIPSLQNGFVWDDVNVIERQYHVFENDGIQSLLIKWLSAERKGPYYRPVHQLSYLFDYSIWSLNPFGYHLTNLIIYSLCSCFLYFLILMILRDYNVEQREYIAFLSALYFVVHPMHVENVVWIAGRTDMLCAFFFLCAFIFHVKTFHNINYLLLAIPLFFLSLMSKEIAVSFPFVAFAYNIIRDRTVTIKTIASFGLYLAVLVIYLYLRSKATQGHIDLEPSVASDISSDGVLVSNSIFIQYVSDLKVMFGAYLFYFTKMLFPYSFNSFITSVPHGSHILIFSIATFCGLLYLAYLSIKNLAGIVAFSIIWIVLTLGPSVLVSVLDVATTLLAERYVFLPTAGLSLLAGYLLSNIMKSSSSRYVVLLLLTVFLSINVFIMVDRQSVWRDRLTFWKHASSKSTKSIVPNINYGLALVDAGKFDLGIELLEKPLISEKRVNPELKVFAANALGIAYMKKGENNIAMDWFHKAISYNPDYHKSYYHIGLIYYAMAKDKNSFDIMEEAEKYLNRAIKLNKSYARAYLLIARIKLEYGEVQQAKDYAAKAVQLGLENSMQKDARQILNR